MFFSKRSRRPVVLSNFLFHDVDRDGVPSIWPPVAVGVVGGPENIGAPLVR